MLYDDFNRKHRHEHRHDVCVEAAKTSIVYKPGHKPIFIE
jgi:hypothetical protein